MDSGPSTPTLKRRLATGGAWALAGKGGTLGLNFVTVALVARVLSPDDAGAYFLAQSLVLFTAMITRLGLETTVVFLVSSALGARDPARASGVVRRIALLGALSALVAGCALSLGGAAYIGRELFHSELVAGVGPTVGLWAASLSLQVLLSEAFRGFHAIREATLFGGLLSGLFTAAGILCLHLLRGTVSLGDAARIASLSTFASTLASAAALFRRAGGAGAGGSSAAPEYGALLRESSPVLVNNVMTFVLLNVDVWVLGAHLPEREVAVYAAAAKMVTLVSLTFMIANQVLPPVVGELTARGDKALLEKVLRGVAAAVGPPALLILAAFVVAGPLVMRLAFGPFYESGAPVLTVLAVAQVVGVLTGSSVTVLLMTGNQRAAMWISGAAALLATAGAFAAVRFGTLGVAVAIAAVLSAQQLATLFAAKKLAGVWAHANFRLIRPALAEVMRRRKPR